MMNKIVCFVLAMCITMTCAPRIVCQQKDKAQPRTEKIKRKVFDIGLNERVTVTLANKSKVYGTIKNIEEDRFFVAEVDRVNLAEINFSDVIKVRNKYCPPNLFTGKRDCPSTRTDIITGVAVIVGIIVAVAVSIPKT